MSEHAYQIIMLVLTLLQLGASLVAATLAVRLLRGTRALEKTLKKSCS